MVAGETIDLEEAALVQLADVAGAEVAIGREGGCVGLGLLPVAAHDLGAFHADLAGLAQGGGVALVVQ